MINIQLISLNVIILVAIKFTNNNGFLKIIKELDDEMGDECPNYLMVMQKIIKNEVPELKDEMY